MSSYAKGVVTLGQSLNFPDPHLPICEMDVNSSHMAMGERSSQVCD